MSINPEELVDIYSLLCRSALNKEYYGESLYRTQRINALLELSIAAGAAGSGLSGLALWKDDSYGQFAWGVIALFSTLLAISKPIIQLNKKIERLAKLYSEHSGNYASLVILASRIRRRNAVDATSFEIYETIEARFVELSREDDPRPDAELLKRCEDAVRVRHPAESFWFPN